MARIFTSLFTLSFVFVSTVAMAQLELSNFNSTGRAGVSTSMNTDYQAVGINPANLGLKPRYETKHVTLGFMEFSGNFYVQGVTMQDVQKYFGGDLSYEEQAEAVEKFAQQQFAINADLNIFGVAVDAGPAVGAFAFTVRDQFRYSHKLSKNTTDFLFHGYTSGIFIDSLELSNGDIVANDPAQYDDYAAIGIEKGISNDGVSLGAITEGTFVRSQWYREYNLSYGRQIYNDDEFVVIAVGVGVKYLQGLNYVDIEAKDGRIQGQAAFSPALGMDNMFSLTSDFNKSGKIAPLGSGFGIDLGVTLQLKEELTIAAAITNIGSITYKSNAYDVRDTVFYEITYPNTGFDISQDLVKWSKVDKITSGLPTVLRLGGSFRLNHLFEVGIDMLAPLNQNPGNFIKPVVSVGGDFYPARFLKLSSGFYIGGNTANKANIPAGITIIAGENGGYEFGFATRDVVSIFKPTSPSYSAAIGLFRFRF